MDVCEIIFKKSSTSGSLSLLQYILELHYENLNLRYYTKLLSILLSCQSTIQQHLLHKNDPSISDWFNIIFVLLSLERLTYVEQ